MYVSIKINCLLPLLRSPKAAELKASQAPLAGPCLGDGPKGALDKEPFCENVLM